MAEFHRIYWDGLTKIWAPGLVNFFWLLVTTPASTPLKNFLNLWPIFILRSMRLITSFQHMSSKNTNAKGMKGRNVCNFFIFFNFAMWITYTFERQSVNSSAIESEVLGTVVWAIIQRMTLPMIIFFRFHALVFCVELRKQYTGTEAQENTS